MDATMKQFGTADKGTQAYAYWSMISRATQTNQDLIYHPPREHPYPEIAPSGSPKIPVRYGKASKGWYAQYNVPRRSIPTQTPRDGIIPWLAYHKGKIITASAPKKTVHKREEPMPLERVMIANKSEPFFEAHAPSSASTEIAPPINEPIIRCEQVTSIAERTAIPLTAVRDGQPSQWLSANNSCPPGTSRKGMRKGIWVRIDKSRIPARFLCHSREASVSTQSESTFTCEATTISPTSSILQKQTPSSITKNFMQLGPATNISSASTPQPTSVENMDTGNNTPPTWDEIYHDFEGIIGDMTFESPMDIDEDIPDVFSFPDLDPTDPIGLKKMADLYEYANI